MSHMWKSHGATPVYTQTHTFRNTHTDIDTEADPDEETDAARHRHTGTQAQTY